MTANIKHTRAIAAASERPELEFAEYDEPALPTGY